MRRRSSPALQMGLAVLGLAAALGLVAWRQGRALDVLGDLSRERSHEGLLIAARADLERRIQTLESRTRVVPEARRLLGMRSPESAEIVILAGEAP